MEGEQELDRALRSSAPIRGERKVLRLKAALFYHVTARSHHAGAGKAPQALTYRHRADFVSPPADRNEAC